MNVTPQPSGIRLSVVIPALNEASCIQQTLSRLQPARARGVEVLLADGGSTDATCERAAGLVDRIVHGARGRARQMNAGAAVARGGVLLFLHADTLCPGDFDLQIDAAMSARGGGWGWFDVRIVGRAWALRVIGAMMNLRTRLTRIATGDQGLFMSKSSYLQVGGFADMPLMEDIAMSASLRRMTNGRVLRGPLLTSGRRWDRDGVLPTVLLMWRLRLAFALGVDPDELHRRYQGERVCDPDS